MVKGFLNEWKAGFSEICAGSSKNNNHSEVSLFHVSPAPAPIQSLSCSRPSQDKAWGDLLTSLQQNQKSHHSLSPGRVLQVYMQDSDGQKLGH